MEKTDWFIIAISVLAMAGALVMYWSITQDTPQKRWERKIKQERRDRKRMIKL